MKTKELKRPPKSVALKLLAFNTNAKTKKSDKASGEFFTAILYLAPFNLSGYQVCPAAKMAGCPEGCLNTSGRGKFSNVQKARIRKTRYYMQEREFFLHDLKKDLRKFSVFCAKHGRKPAIRLNGTSDLNWLKLIKEFPAITFYDYTKNLSDSFLCKATKVKNYNLTLSYSQASWGYATKCKRQSAKYGLNMAVVYRGKSFDEVSERFFSAIDGDKTDLRFLDARGPVFLKAKGKAKKDFSGFVIDL